MKTVLEILAGILLVVWCASCAQPGAVAPGAIKVDAPVDAQAVVDAAVVKATANLTGIVKAEMQKQQTSGPQAGGSGAGWTVNVGQIDGLTTIVAVIAAVCVLGYLWRRGGKWKTVSDVLIKDNAIAGLNQAEKDNITLRAASKGVASLLDKRVQQLKAKP
jgi:hypothetical protein